MKSASGQTPWCCFGTSVPGSSHLRQDLPNQDAIGWRRLPTGLLLTVSDGHGSPHCFRSDVGSRLACEGFLTELEGFLAGVADEELSLIKRLAEERLPAQLTRRWQADVEAHLAADPVSEDEWTQLAAAKGPEAIARLQRQPLLIYGATLLGLVIAERFVLTLQLGDGEIIELDAAGKVAPLLPPDERLIANETTSLCQPDAWREFRFRFQVRATADPALLLLTTDGYFNSFRERAGFYQVATDLAEMLHAEGSGPIEAELGAWLSEASAAGSGDDATLLLAWSPAGLARLFRTRSSSAAPADDVPTDDASQADAPAAEASDASQADAPAAEASAASPPDTPPVELAEAGPAGENLAGAAAPAAADTQNQAETLTAAQPVSVAEPVTSTKAETNMESNTEVNHE